jgi:hypothetical protein
MNEADGKRRPGSIVSSLPAKEGLIIQKKSDNGLDPEPRNDPIDGAVGGDNTAEARLR